MSFLARAGRASRMLCACSLMFGCESAVAAAVDAANGVRSQGCDGRPGLTTRLRQTARLDGVARRWAAGGSLTDAVNATGLRLKHSVSLQLKTPGSDAQLAAELQRRFCRQLTDPDFREFGSARIGEQLWLVIAAPFQPPAPQSAAAVSREILQRVNHVRSSPRRCGRQSFAAAAPLSLSTQLTAAALAHARDMADHDYLAHEGRDGSSPAERAQRQGYRWQLVGENVAGGPQSAREVMDGWLASPVHCQNIMQPRYTQMGVAFATAPRARLVIYWSQLFGRSAD